MTEEKIDDSLFKIPALKKAKGEAAEMTRKLTGSEVMVLK